MGMSTHVVGFRPPDEKWQQMKAVWDACQAAHIAPPAEVEEFFQGEPPDDQGVEVRLDGQALREWTNEYASGYEVVVDKLPRDVTVIRFYNSW